MTKQIESVNMNNNKKKNNWQKNKRIVIIKI